MSKETSPIMDEINSSPAHNLGSSCGGGMVPGNLIASSASLVLVLGEGACRLEKDSSQNTLVECLVCWKRMESLESNTIAEDEASKLTLLEFCNLLKVSMPPRTKSSLKNYGTPLCSTCRVAIGKMRCLLLQIEELERSLAATRTLIKEQVIVNYRANCNGEKDAHTLSEILNAIAHVRNSIRKDLLAEATSKASSDSQTQVGKRKRKGPDKKGKKTPENDANNSEKVVESASHRSSFGRVVKRPKYFMMSEEEEDSGKEEEVVDEGEKKVDPGPSQNLPNLPNQTEEQVQQVVSISSIKMEPPTTSEVLVPEPAVDSSAEVITADILTSEGENEDAELSNDSDTEFRINSPDVNWSDGEVSDDETNKSVKKSAKRRKRVVRKKTLPSKMQVKLVGTDGEELGSSEIKDGKVVINNDFHKKLMDGEAVIRVDKEIMGIRVKCDLCDATFTDVKKRDRHARRFHEGKKDYECKTCKEQFVKLKDLVQHRRDQHRPKEPKIDEDGRKTFECEFCQNAFKNHCDLQIHRRRHTGERPFKCEYCNEGFISKGRYEVHIEVVHPDRPPLKCEYCPRSFFRHHRRRDHMKSHTGERPYLCEICSKSFSQPAYLKYHQTKHKELNLDEYTCDECDKTFASPVNLKFHKETQHQKHYRYHCGTCGHGATHKSHLKLHMRSHTGERPHGCQYCGKSFSRGSQLKIHIRSHTGERPYVCKICEKTFTNSSKLRRHELTHTSGKSKRRNEVVKVTSLPSTEPQESVDIKIVPEALPPIIEENVNVAEHAVLKLEHVQTAVEESNEPEIQQQVITIEQANGITYQVIATNDVLNEPYTEYIVLNGDFTLA